ncbi:MAG TPA: hypothetical protein DCP07_07965 [Lachnospiraceae bacterium]|nr:hypothetical protein [Lachnospiraceae bacterium]
MNKNKKVYSKIVEKMVDDMTLFDDDLMSKVFDQNIPATKLLISTKKGRQIMCEAVEKYAKEQYEIGISKGKDIGQKKGKKEGKIESIRALMNNLNFTAEQAMESLDIPKTEYSKYKSKL